MSYLITPYFLSVTDRMESLTCSILCWAVRICTSRTSTTRIHGWSSSSWTLMTLQRRMRVLIHNICWACPAQALLTSLISKATKIRAVLAATTQKSQTQRTWLPFCLAILGGEITTLWFPEAARPSLTMASNRHQKLRRRPFKRNPLCPAGLTWNFMPK